MSFDIEAARKAGYSDEVIAQEISKNTNFDVQGALKAGYSLDQISKEVNKKAPVDLSKVDYTGMKPYGTPSEESIKKAQGSAIMAPLEIASTYARGMAAYPLALPLGIKKTLDKYGITKPREGELEHRAELGKIADAIQGPPPEGVGKAIVESKINPFNWPALVGEGIGERVGGPAGAAIEIGTRDVLPFFLPKIGKIAKERIVTPAAELIYGKALKPGKQLEFAEGVVKPEPDVTGNVILEKGEIRPERYREAPNKITREDVIKEGVITNKPIVTKSLKSLNEELKVIQKDVDNLISTRDKAIGNEFESTSIGNWNNEKNWTREISKPKVSIELIKKKLDVIEQAYKDSATPEVNYKGAIDRVRKKVEAFEGQEFPKIRDAVTKKEVPFNKLTLDEQAGLNLFGKELPLGKAQDIKKNIYELKENKYGKDVADARTRAEMAVGNSIMNQLNELVPGLKDKNFRQGVKIELKDAINDRLHSLSTRDFANLYNLITFGGGLASYFAGGPVAATIIGILAPILSHPTIASLIATKGYKVGKYAPQVGEVARVGSIASSPLPPGIDRRKKEQQKK